MTFRIIRLAATVRLLATGVALLPLHHTAAETLYHFVDENGVAHFSNVPRDARYRPFETGGSASSVAGSRTLPAPAAVAPPGGVPGATQPYPEFEEILETEPDDDEEAEEDHAEDS